MSTRGYVIAVILLGLLVILLPACGGDGEKTTATGTPGVTANPTATPAENTSAPYPATSGNPVKIGAIQSWSGPTAVSGIAYADPVIKFVEMQVNDVGGILGGRPLKIVKCDNGGTVSGANACAAKLVRDDKVSVLTMGGVSGAEFTAVADAAEELKVPYICFAHFIGMEEKQFTVSSSPNDYQFTTSVVGLVTEEMQPVPKTVAFIQMQDDISIYRAKEESDQLKAAGIETVYTQDIPLDTMDFMPYLTKIKYLGPDVLVMNLGSEWCLTVAKQIIELGGWGNTRVIAYSQALTAAKMAGAEGWILVTTWTPGVDYPASQEFEKDWKAVNGNLPGGNHVYFYLSLLTAVEAIKFAGTDGPVKINDGIRSGNLQFDTPLGMAHFTAKGDSSLKYMCAQIQKGGSVVPFKQ